MEVLARNRPSPDSKHGKSLLVEQVAQSDLFLKSPRLREFFLYVANCTLENRRADVRESVIAERVFGRRPEAGLEDTIVRAEARNLRKRLDLYFETEGRDEPTVIVMPKGGYLLDFPLREPKTQTQGERAFQQAENKDRLLAALPTNISNAPLTLSRCRYLCLVLAGISVLVLAVAGYWYQETKVFAKRLAGLEPAFPFSSVLRPDRDTLIVTSDTGVLQISSLLHRGVSLDEYIARRYSDLPATNPPNLAANWNLYEFTDGREMAIAGLIIRQNPLLASHILMRSGHAVQLQDFKDHNAILIGSPISNPWAQILEDQMNFVCDLASDGHIAFRNRVAGLKEEKEYPDAEDLRQHRTYARIAFLPSSSDAGAVLSIAGTTAQSTQAAGELLVQSPKLAARLKAFGLNTSGSPHFFEILIRSTNFVGGAIMSEVVACRTSPFSGR